MCCSNTPLYNTINCLHQALPCFCHVTLLTFHVIVFAKCSQFSISQPCLPLTLICAIPAQSSGLPRSSASQTKTLKACVSKTLVAVLHFYYFLFKAGHCMQFILYTSGESNQGYNFPLLSCPRCTRYA